MTKGSNWIRETLFVSAQHDDLPFYCNNVHCTLRTQVWNSVVPNLLGIRRVDAMNSYSNKEAMRHILRDITDYICDTLKIILITNLNRFAYTDDTYVHTYSIYLREYVLSTCVYFCLLFTIMRWTQSARKYLTRKCIPAVLIKPCCLSRLCCAVNQINYQTDYRLPCTG